MAKTVETVQPPKIVNNELHIFSDGSSSVYGSAAYLHIQNRDGRVVVVLVELMGATMSTALAQELEKKVNVNIVARWTDSLSTLRYIRDTEKCFKVYEANRITDVRHRSDPVKQWNCVPSEDNPADCCSQAMPISVGEELIGEEGLDDETRLWFCGPEFLWLPRNQWPSQPDEDMQDSEWVQEEDGLNEVTTQEK